MLLHYEGCNLYKLHIGHQEITLSQDEIQEIVNSVGEHIVNEYESPFELPNQAELQNEVDLLEEKLEQADGEINDLEQQLSETAKEKLILPISEYDIDDFKDLVLSGVAFPSWNFETESGTNIEIEFTVEGTDED